MREASPGKVCKKCLSYKEFSEFYRNSELLDGHYNTCILCYRERVRLHRRDNDHVRDKDRERYRTNPAIRKRLAENLRRWRKERPERAATRTSMLLTL